MSVKLCIYISSTTYCDWSPVPANSISNNTLADASIQWPQESKLKPRTTIKAKAEDFGHKAKAKDLRYQGQGQGLGFWP